MTQKKIRQYPDRSQGGGRLRALVPLKKILMREDKRKEDFKRENRSKASKSTPDKMPKGGK
jgi:hypothetical protein